MSVTPGFTPGRGLSLELQGHIAVLEFSRPPYNYFDKELIEDLAAAFDYLDNLEQCRVTVLQAQGKVFCAGADFSGDEQRDPEFPRRLYRFAVRLFRVRKPVICVVEGAAVGGGLGLALFADFRVTSERARFSANFNRLGIHPGFGLSVTLPRLLGQQQAALLLATGRRIDGAEAVRIGLADVLAPAGEERQAALALAHEIALCAPLSLMSTRETLRQGLAEQVERAVEREADEQAWQIRSEDFAEGTLAMAERREPRFKGR